jgi:nitric-oxide synthase
LHRRLRRISKRERKEEARAFLEEYHASIGASAADHARRWSEVRRTLSRFGWYEHTPQELAYGARVAWRNHGRCIGRLYWESLEVFDCRNIEKPDDIAARMEQHLRDANSDGRIRSIISVFAPVKGDEHPAWIESEQLTQYACHQLPDRTVLGDRQNIEVTRIAESMGWKPPGEPGQFDILPWFLRDKADRRLRYDLKPGSVREVAIRHPTHTGLDELGLRWYTVPIVTGMILTIGGIDYPCAPFNGFYLCTEIASRDFGDVKRYNLLPDVARALDIETGTHNPFWKDEALTELNRAVLASYNDAKVTIVDHHTVASQYMTFHGREQAAGRRVAGDWRWIVPPQASAAFDVFHLRMRNFHPVPNYYRSRGEDGLRLMPWYGDRYRRRWQRWSDRIVRRWKIWKRMPW